jgi:hypothetical protein
MVKTGRILSLIALWGVLSFVGLAVLDNPDITVYALTIYSVIGVVTLGAAAVSWGLAILHWALRYTAEHRAEWGIAVTLGTPLGAGLYWFLANPREHLRQAP